MNTQATAAVMLEHELKTTADHGLKLAIASARAAISVMHDLDSSNTVCQGCRTNIAALEAWNDALVAMLWSRPRLTGHRHD